ncbi:MAG: hypothetical protein GVY20_06120, partial [Bacteroidetes bacterium]|nr:hypothetical protein [Bacteroidota bacterium]
SIVTGNIWAGFLTAIAVGIVYLIIMDRKLIQPVKNPDQKVVIRVLIVLLVLVQSFSAYVIYDRSQFTENNLDVTRSSIDEGASKIYTQRALLNVFKHYYNQVDQADATIASSFREVLGSQLNDDGTIDLVEPNINQDIVFKYEVFSPDEVIITASAKIGMGENPDFVNVSDETGKYQAQATLTPEGIDYEREN